MSTSRETAVQLRWGSEILTFFKQVYRGQASNVKRLTKLTFPVLGLYQNEIFSFSGALACPGINN